MDSKIKSAIQFYFFLLDTDPMNTHRKEVVSCSLSYRSNSGFKAFAPDTEWYNRINL